MALPQKSRDNALRRHCHRDQCWSHVESRVYWETIKNHANDFVKKCGRGEKSEGKDHPLVNFKLIYTLRLEIERKKENSFFIIKTISKGETMGDMVPSWLFHHFYK